MAALIYKVFDAQAAECDADAPGKDASHGSGDFFAVKFARAGNQSCNDLAAPGNDNFLALFDPVEKSTELVFGLECPDLTHDFSLNKLDCKLDYTLCTA